MIQSIARAAGVLEALQRERTLGITELADRLDLAPSTVHGIVASLRAHGLVSKERRGNRYSLGPALVRLGNVYLDTNEVRARARPFMDELSSELACASRLGVELFDHVLVVHHVAAPASRRHMNEIGLSMPAHATALGKVLAAHAEPGSVLAGLVELERLVPMTSATLPTGADLAEHLDEVRAGGLAIEREEGVIGESGLAVPVTDRLDGVVAALGVVVPEDRWPDTDGLARTSGALQRAARELSRELGASRWPP